MPLVMRRTIGISPFQARETPVVQDPSAIEASEEAEAAAGQDATVVARATAGDPHA